MKRALAALALLLALGATHGAWAQSTRDAQKKLDRITRELKAVAAERRKLEGQRGTASRELRQVDEQVGTTARALQDTEVRMQRQRASLTALQARRIALSDSLAGRRAELARLLRAAQRIGGAAPLKLMLAQDKVADGQRLLAWHGYLQRERARRIARITAELAELRDVEAGIARTTTQLGADKRRQQAQALQLQRDRDARTQALAKLDLQYRDKRAREQALGTDAKALESLLKQLRAAAARAEAERRAAAAKAAREARAAAKAAHAAGNTPSRASAGVARKPNPVSVAAAPAVRVGGIGWPVNGALLAGFRGRLPDGRSSNGLLIAASAGTPVRAVADGTVVFADWMTGYGNIVIVDHGNGTMSLYAHNDALLRDVGDRVRRGDSVASVGNSGGQGQAALYFELRRGGAPVDPRGWLQQR